MKISVEISMYPLSEEYEGPILEFISMLHKEPSLDVRTNAMSTQVFGEYDTLMTHLSSCIKTSMQHGPKIVFVTKFLSSDVSAR